MGQNLKAYLQEETCYTAEELVQRLAESIPGRSAGDRYVIAAKLVTSNSFIMEMDDGCQFKMTCEKLN
jgi:hypothetical protein